MVTRDSNIELNLTGDDDSVVRKQSNGQSTATETTETDAPEQEATGATSADHGTTNPDGSVTEYATPPEPAGSVSSENVPGSPIAAEINAFKHEIDHPDDFTATEFKAVALWRRYPDASHKTIAERLDIGETTVTAAVKKATFATLEGVDEIHDALAEQSDTKQAVIVEAVRRPDATDSELADTIGKNRGTVKAYRRNAKPLIRHLRAVGLPQTVTDGTTHNTMEHATETDDEALEQEIATLKDDLEHPEDFTPAELTGLAAKRLYPDGSQTEVAERAGVSQTSVGNGKRKQRIETLSGPDEIYEEFADRTPRQQTVLAAAVADPDKSEAEIVDQVGDSRGAVTTTLNVYQGLIRKLRAVGLPDEDDEAATGAREGTEDGSETDQHFTCSECGEVFDTLNARNGHMAAHKSEEKEEEPATVPSSPVDDDTEHPQGEPETVTLEEVIEAIDNVGNDLSTTQKDTDIVDEDASDIAHSSGESQTSESTNVEASRENTHRERQRAFEDIRQHVTGLRDAAETEHSLSDSPGGGQSAASRIAAFEAVLAYIDAQDKDTEVT